MNMSVVIIIGGVYLIFGIILMVIVSTLKQIRDNQGEMITVLRILVNKK